jgi:subtilisin-like proprotein convertase family protein/uncharacterized protein YvpB
MQIPYRYFYAAIICIFLLAALIFTFPANALTDEDPIDPTLTISMPLQPSATATEELTSTLTPTPTLQEETQTLTPTETATVTTTSTPTIKPTSPILFAPLIFKQPTAIIPEGEPEKLLFCNAQPLDIPDNVSLGVTSVITINEPRTLVDLDVRVNITHSWVGDLQLILTHQETGKSINLIDRPGVPASPYGCDNDNIVAILDDEITLPVENKCTSTTPTISGIYTPNEALHTFDGFPFSGSWELTISDNNKSDIGRVNDWCLAATLYEIPLEPTPSPAPPELPNQAFIAGISGRSQALPLDCETRSAIDWANYFGVHIDELTFFNQLPKSDNPDAGFVGDVYGSWGQIPPAPYGVHAEPVAELLRLYGLSAYADRPLKWNELRSEIAAGHPVIVWIVGSVVNGIPIYYQASGGHITVVAPYEHTVIVTGFTETRVYYLNGSYIYSKSIEQFLDSWSVMGNMAITTRP